MLVPVGRLPFLLAPSFLLGSRLIASVSPIFPFYDSPAEYSAGAFPVSVVFLLGRAKEGRCKTNYQIVDRGRAAYPNPYCGAPKLAHYIYAYFETALDHVERPSIEWALEVLKSIERLAS